MIGIFVYLQIFVEYCCSTILFFVPGLFTYKQFAIVMAIFSATYIVWILIKKLHGKMNMTSFVGIIAVLLLIVLYYSTQARYSNSDLDYYHSYFLVFAGQTAPGVITALLLSQTNDIDIKIKRIAPYVSIIFTIIAFSCSLHPSMRTSGGLAANENYLNYQTLSYMAAYATGFAEYTLLTDAPNVPALFKTRIGIIIEFALIFINLLSILIAGGRGGIVNYLIFGAITVFFAMRNNKVTGTTLIKGSFLVVLVGIIGTITFRYAANLNISTSGFSRITALLTGNSSSEGRQILQSAAIRSYQEAPIIGHGLGSVFPEVGFHSHNLFTDALVETGIIGVCVIVVLLICTIRRLIEMTRYDHTNIFWVYVFLCGFVMAMFSGYYLAQLPMWWVVAYSISKNRSLQETN